MRIVLQKKLDVLFINARGNQDIHQLTETRLAQIGLHQSKQGLALLAKGLKKPTRFLADGAFKKRHVSHYEKCRLVTNILFDEGATHMIITPWGAQRQNCLWAILIAVHPPLTL